jgi:hypothetical protein
MNEIFQYLQHTQLASYIGRQDQMFGAVAQMVHIVGLILVLAPILLISLRLFGTGLVCQTPAQLARATAPFIWTGLVLLALSGIVILLPTAAHYYPNPIFRFKFILLGVAIVFHLTWYRKVVYGVSSGSLINGSTAILALVLWFGVAYSGRFIGFF